jgi:hypothetical protein
MVLTRPLKPPLVLARLKFAIDSYIKRGYLRTSAREEILPQYIPNGPAIRSNSDTCPARSFALIAAAAAAVAAAAVAAAAVASAAGKPYLQIPMPADSLAAAGC